MNDDNALVFVYGTLKKDMSNHGVMGNAQFIGRTVTAEPKYVMKEFNSRSRPGSFSPGVIEAALAGEQGGFIEGEMYRVGPDLLHALDVFEGVFKGNYRREKGVALRDGAFASMYVKLVNGPIDSNPKPRYTFFDPRTKIYTWNERRAHRL